MPGPVRRRPVRLYTTAWERIGRAFSTASARALPPASATAVAPRIEELINASQQEGRGCDIHNADADAEVGIEGLRADVSEVVKEAGENRRWTQDHGKLTESFPEPFLTFRTDARGVRHYSARGGVGGGPPC